MGEGITVPDAELVARAQRGDGQAFGELISRHEPAMYAIARAYFASEADAEDAVQESFVKAFEALKQLKENGRFAGWVARITVNMCLDTLRKRTDKVSLADFASTAQLRPRLGQEYLSPATLAGNGEEAELVRVAVGLLPQTQRVVLMLRYAEDMSYERIADYLDVPTATVRGRLARAKRALQGELSKLSRSSG